MTFKRIAAVLAAIALIAIAWTVRRQIDQSKPNESASTTDSAVSSSMGSSTNTTAPVSGEIATQIVCSPDLIKACEDAASTSGGELSVTTDNIDALIANPADAPTVWVTLDPLPAALTTVEPSVVYVTTPVAESPLSLVVSANRAEALTTTCGAAVNWRCLGDHAGQSWTTLGGDASWSTLRPGISSSRTAIGAVSITEAVRSYFGSTSINAGDPSFIAWGRQFGAAVPSSSLSAGTAVDTIQVRPSLLDVAVGVPAELANTDDARFAIIDLDQSTNATVVVAARQGSEAPSNFVDALRDELAANGWSAVAGSAPDPVAINGGDVVAALGAWNDVQR